MKLKPVKLAPALIAVCVIVFISLLRLLEVNFFERLEWVTYDLRVREAVRFPSPMATNLGFVEITDNSITAVGNGSLGYRYGLLWPRHVYGRLVEELAAQKARAVAFDVIVAELRPDHPSTEMENGQRMESDDFFALQMRLAGNVILADTKDLSPTELFSTNAVALGDITTDPNKDSDGVLRRAPAFRRRWHWALRQAEADPGFGIDLSRARIEPRQIILPRSNGEEIKLPIDDLGQFELADVGGDKLPPGVPPKARAYTDIWHMGIVLAAQELGLDLAKADVDLAHGRIRLHGTNGVERILPVDRHGYFYIDWGITPDDPRLIKQPIEAILQADTMRLKGQAGELTNTWAGRLVVIGSSATGNNLSDRGATPLESYTMLASEHWNVANSILTDRYVRRSTLATDLLLIATMGIAGALLTWQFRALLAFLSVMLLAVGYIALGNSLYVEHRYWLPLVLPVGGALLMTHVCLVTWRVVFEQAEQRRVKSIFSTVVSPKIMTELLKVEKLRLGGARREVTVLFADVRGFTEFTDLSQERAAAHIAQKKLSGEAAEAYFDAQASETLGTVNLYLGVVAETIFKHDATLDKFIGDCVMAFWGAPVPTTNHAVACVRAAIDAQRAIHALNQQRAAENQRRETENRARASAGLEPRPLLPLLLLGSGINTGIVTVGMMGSETKAGVLHQANYTVFGREVNLASRLEGLSGQGRIFISEATFAKLQRSEPALAATCVAQPLAKVKGFGAAVKVYEVPWQPAGTVSPGPDASPGAGAIAAADRDSLPRSRPEPTA